MASSVSFAEHRLIGWSAAKRWKFETLPDCKAALPGLPLPQASNACQETAAKICFEQID
jgi:hypothetical protein